MVQILWMGGRKGWGRSPEVITFNAYYKVIWWTIEILSPGQSQTKVIRNILHCLEYGAEMGWLLDPDESCVFVYDADQSVKMFETSDVMLPLPGFADIIQLMVDAVFGWLLE